jgi:hypothetical protein
VHATSVPEPRLDVKPIQKIKEETSETAKKHIHPTPANQKPRKSKIVASETCLSREKGNNTSIIYQVNQLMT